MWQKVEWMGRPMRLKLARVGLLVPLANRYTTRGAQIQSCFSSRLYANQAKFALIFYLWLKEEEEVYLCFPKGISIK